MARRHWLLRPRALVTAAAVLITAVGALTLWDAARGAAGATGTRTAWRGANRWP
jgi:hypothetical protein